ncbi:hypothetical protein SB6420_00969 [Klebsiella pasteurii]|nr:hypothetical protein SB6420_00969 [Klebsiella pasteurii]
MPLITRAIYFTFMINIPNYIIICFILGITGAIQGNNLHSPFNTALNYQDLAKVPCFKSSTMPFILFSVKP